MTVVLLIGSDIALLEGVAQSLAAAGHGVEIAHDVTEAIELSAVTPALVVVAERELSRYDARVTRLAVPGGALLLYHAGPRAVTPLSPPLQRAVLAELALPLERHRLVALIQHVAERVEASGRGRRDTPPERHAP